MAYVFAATAVSAWQACLAREKRERHGENRNGKCVTIMGENTRKHCKSKLSAIPCDKYLRKIESTCLVVVASISMTESFNGRPQLFDGICIVHFLLSYLDQHRKMISGRKIHRRSRI